MEGRLGPDSEIAGYRIQSVLGEGGTATVYLAERPHGGACALKLLSTELVTDPDVARRFKREAGYAESLDHPNIPKFYDAGEASDGRLFLATEYVRGVDLRTLIERDGVSDLPRALYILGHISDALDYAHAKSLIHRDVKPGNIIVATGPGPQPRAYVTDFGLGKNPSKDSVALTQRGQYVGTIAYTAPEEILAQPRDHRIDIYSMGCVLYEMLAGVPPFVRDRDLDLLYAHIGDPRPNVTHHRRDLPSEIDGVVTKAMAISPEDRYASCAEFIAAASTLLPDIPSSAQHVMPAGSGSLPREDSLRAALHLVATTGPALGIELIVDDAVALGRLTTLDGALREDAEISRRHARIHRAHDGGFVVVDDGSTNGTFVNGARVSEPHPLRPGDQLRIGKTVFAARRAAP